MVFIVKKITWPEILGAILFVIGFLYSLLYILIEQHRGFIYHAFNVVNILIACLFFLLLRFPIDRINLKINLIDKIVTFITNASLFYSFALTLFSWGEIQNTEASQVSFLDVIKNYDQLYYVAFLFISLGLLFSALKPILLHSYNSYKNKQKTDNMNTNRSVQSVINELYFTATKTTEGITGKLTGTTSAGLTVGYTDTKKSASELITDIDKNYPDIEFEVLKTFLDAAKLIE